ncbi:hypothetical protein JTE90_020636 [Oedothorax gibbosus]|uniref:Uncharacterized protein n=1 Tax=Oedothorax gibbosus TaxID=931172 RepID=A0AAV6TTJ4_9ARAC|nr:hypothetical protein JTE90_020636 [Oedothorax gibbosus]
MDRSQVPLFASSWILNHRPSLRRLAHPPSLAAWVRWFLLQDRSTPECNAGGSIATVWTPLRKHLRTPRVARSCQVRRCPRHRPRRRGARPGHRRPRRQLAHSLPAGGPVLQMPSGQASGRQGDDRGHGRARFPPVDG